MRVVRIMANLNPGGCDVPPVHRHQSVGALNSTRKSWHFLAWKNTTNALKCWKPQSKSFSILCKFRSQKSAMSWTLANCHILCTALFVWRRSRSWTLQHQFPASNASPTIRSREPPFWASFGHFNMRKRWINWINLNMNKSYIRKCHQKVRNPSMQPLAPLAQKEKAFSQVDTQKRRLAN